jgi:hypothetical protein
LNVGEIWTALADIEVDAMKMAIQHLYIFGTLTLVHFHFSGQSCQEASNEAPSDLDTKG